MKKYIIYLLSFVMILWEILPLQAFATEQEETIEIGIEAPYALLMEVSTGTVLYEKESHVATEPASVTKIMTMLLIFEALEEQKIKLEDVVVVSEKAASMGGSQVYLEPGEQQTVDDLLKCIAIASGNDACVAMAEHVSGSEEAFVGKMNEKAKELGMKDTHFVNCNGLDADGHLMSAYDVALMSRELLTKYPKIHDYCTVWMDTIVHHTARGDSEFGLNNTNKLIRHYEYSTGLKTGSTGKAGFCVSATAKKGEMELIAVIMKGETSKSRFRDATTLLNYGFANYQIYVDTNREREKLPGIPVKSGVEESVTPAYEKDFSCLLMNGESLTSIEKKLTLPEELTAPVEKGQVIGSLSYYHNNEKLGETAIVAPETIEAAKYPDYVKRVWLAWMM